LITTDGVIPSEGAAQATSKSKRIVEVNEEVIFPKVNWRFSMKEMSSKDTPCFVSFERNQNENRLFVSGWLVLLLFLLSLALN
jgi:hypothetical protein